MCIGVTPVHEKCSRVLCPYVRSAREKKYFVCIIFCCPSTQTQARCKDEMRAASFSPPTLFMHTCLAMAVCGMHDCTATAVKVLVHMHPSYAHSDVWVCFLSSVSVL
jgi:hypothetical protein